MAPHDGRGRILFALSGKWIAAAHCVCAYGAFVGALCFGLGLHYKQIVKNEFYGYPEEWFPSVSATIGDWYPERSVFHILIALTATPRFLMLLLWYLLAARNDRLTKALGCLGFVRTVLCGGWVYVSSTDDHQWHDILMISYLLTNIPWFFGVLAVSEPGSRSQKYRKRAATLFFSCIPPLVYYFIQHKVHRVPGAYTTYAFFEWSLVLTDVAYDSSTFWELSNMAIQIVDTRPSGTKGPIDARAHKESKQSDTKILAANVFSVREFLDFVAFSYLGFVFWSMQTALGVLVWYFPLWNMGISGYEAMLLCDMSPFLLSISPLSRLITAYPAAFHLISLVGLASRWVLQPNKRLIILGIGLSISLMTWVATFKACASGPRDRLLSRVGAFLCGLVLSGLAKYAFHTNNPIWPVMNENTRGHNVLGLVVAVVACVWIALRRRAVQPVAMEPSSYQGKSKLAASFLVAGLFFQLLFMVSEPTAIILNIWEGYPVQGPIPVPHGALSLIVFCVAVNSAMRNSERFLRKDVFAISCVGLVFYHNLSGWIAYIGGVCYAYIVIAAFPAAMRNALQFPAGSTFGLIFLFFNIAVLMSVWVVAYAFVPGGPVLRERTWVLLCVVQAMIGIGVFKFNSEQGNSHETKTTTYPLVSLRRLRLFTSIIAFVTCLLSVFVAYVRFPSFSYTPYHADVKLFTAGIWTIHFGLDNAMWVSDIRARDIIRDLELDVIGLLESDTQRMIGGFRDMTQFLSEDLGMFADYGPSPRKHTWGAALLSKFPIVQSTHHLLPSPHGELAPAIHATLDVFGTLVDVIVSHNGQEEDPLDRQLQSQMLGSIIRESPRPFVFLGYVVSHVAQPPQTYITKDNGMQDIEPADWDRWCQYIFYRGVQRVGYARVDRGSITDTEIQTGKFVVGGDDNGTEMVRVSEADVPEGYRYPAMFRGAGVRGHKYNNNEVVKEPWYYGPKAPEPQEE